MAWVGCGGQAAALPVPQGPLLPASCPSGPRAQDFTASRSAGSTNSSDGDTTCDFPLGAAARTSVSYASKGVDLRFDNRELASTLRSSEKRRRAASLGRLTTRSSSLVRPGGAALELSVCLIGAPHVMRQHAPPRRTPRFLLACTRRTAWYKISRATSSSPSTATNLQSAGTGFLQTTLNLAEVKGLANLPGGVSPTTSRASAAFDQCIEGSGLSKRAIKNHAFKKAPGARPPGFQNGAEAGSKLKYREGCLQDDGALRPRSRRSKGSPE